jgi:hypothetical protein
MKVVWRYSESSLTQCLVYFLGKTTVIYFFVDLTWVVRVPICVKSPGVIIKVSYTKHSQCLVRHDVRVHSLFVLFCLVCYYLASHRCHAVSDWTRLLSGIPLVHGRYLICGSEHMVPHFASCGAQKQPAYRPSLVEDSLWPLLFHLDHDPLHHLPRYPRVVSSNCRGTNPRDRYLFPFAHGIYSGAFCLVSFECEMDLRFVPTDCEEVVGCGSQTNGGTKWIVKMYIYIMFYMSTIGNPSGVN